MKKLRSHRHQFHSICRKWLADQIISQDVGLGNRSCQSQMKLLCKFPWPIHIGFKTWLTHGRTGKILYASPAPSAKLDQMWTGWNFQPPIQWIVQNTKFPSLFYCASIVIHSQKRLIKHHWIPLVQRCVSSSCISCVLRGGHATYSPGRHIACASGFSSLVPRVFYRLCRGRLFSTLPTFVHRASLFGLSVVFIFGVSF